MEVIRWGVMGAGGIARRRTIPEGILSADNARLAVVYSPQSGREVAEQFGVPWAASEEALFDVDFDALYVASPVDCHRRQVERAAAAGRHVLCEKPLAVDVADAAAMVEACRRAGVLLGVGFMMRMHPHHRRAAALVAAGGLGRPVYARAQLSCCYPPAANAWRQVPARSGGGTLPDLASHCLDLLEMILGDRIRAVQCRKANLVFDYPVEDSAVVLVEFAGGTLATVDCLFNVPDESVKNRLEIYGSLGSLLAEGTLGQSQLGALRWLPGKSSPGYDALQRRTAHDVQAEESLPPGSLYRAQIEDFSRAVQTGTESAAPGRQGLWIQRVLAACHRSAETGAIVAVDAIIEPSEGAAAPR